jgi:hypothetical protein
VKTTPCFAHTIASTTALLALAGSLHAQATAVNSTTDKGPKTIRLQEFEVSEPRTSAVNMAPTDSRLEATQPESIINLQGRDSGWLRVVGEVHYPSDVFARRVLGLHLPRTLPASPASNAISRRRKKNWPLHSGPSQARITIKSAPSLRGGGAFLLAHRTHTCASDCRCFGFFTGERPARSLRDDLTPPSRWFSTSPSAGPAWGGRAG